MAFVTIDPTTGRKLRSFKTHTRKDTERILAASEKAFLAWRQRPMAERAKLLHRIAKHLKETSHAYARLITREMGKPYSQAVAEVEKSALTCTYYATHAASFLADEVPPGAAEGVRVSFEPLGTILAIMPWNFPVWQAIRAIAPNLMAGNAIILKHAPSVTSCALMLEREFLEAGCPKGLFQVLLAEPQAIPRVIQDRRIAAVTLTGSTRAGKSVAAAAGAAMKKGVFELGGSDPYLILADADIKQAAEICANSRLTNSGQSCVCAKRFIVVKSVRAAFEKEFVERMRARKVGQPLEPGIDVGPLARADLRDGLDRQVRQSIAKGATVLLGGKAIAGPGYFYEPTVLTDVKPGMPAYEEELFGPVASVIVVANEQEAIKVANSTVYGLGSAVFTRSRKTAERVASQIIAGQVFVNDFVKSDPRYPFGGVKDSGYGRELGSFGIREFVNTKLKRFA
jgi:succinate-semialdehyde dehydrogenase/glutarate-semialdehyde dehydrogenase